MLLLRLLLLLIVLIVCATTDQDVDLEEIVHLINEDENSSWTAELVEPFKSMTLEERQARLMKDFGEPPPNPITLNNEEAEQEPSDFDTTKSVIKVDVVHVYITLTFSPYWAFASASALADRFHQDFGLSYMFSPQSMVSCRLESLDSKCDGATINEELSIVENVGVMREECLPYVSDDGTTIPSCPDHCVNGDPIVKYFGRDSYYCTGSGFEREECIKQILRDYGSHRVTFAVYSDFNTYSSGVYEYTYGVLEGYHAVKLLGYGVDAASGKPYWLLQNSWGNAWGEAGYFRFLRSGNHCRIEELAAGSHPVNKTCLNDCNHRGECVYGNCVCNEGWTGIDCSEPDEQPCPNDCSGNGDCIDGVCHCFDGWTGIDCSEPDEQPCPNDCSGNGDCIDGVCHCFDGWTGIDCSEPDEQPCPNDCSGNGDCIDGVCHCFDGWTGIDCSEPDEQPCPNDCSGNGDCIDGVCHCFDGWTGIDCSEPDEQPCPKDCSGNGDCIDGVCHCFDGWTGIDCSEPDEQPCPNDCSGNGDCIDGVCHCFDGWTGIDCSEPDKKHVQLGGHSINIVFSNCVNFTNVKINAVIN
ncbi:hypothetical protein P9112_010799 [Eukaryota sp. TZLM1-RC]